VFEKFQDNILELVGFLRCNPMTRIDVFQPKQWEETAYDWDDFVWDIMTLRASYEERRLLKPDLIRVIRKGS